MVITAPAKPSARQELAEVLAGRTWTEILEHVAMLAMLVIWAVPFTRAVGGRGVHNELLFCGALLLILPAMQAWRTSHRSIALAGLTAVAAELVCVFAPTHWYGSDVAVEYAIAAACFVAGRRYVRDVDRRLLVAIAICLAGLYEFEQAFVAWWGSGNAATEMSGTFYWHNPYAAFLLPGAVVGLGLVASRRSPASLVGWVSVPFCTAGIVFSSSRATMAALVVAWVMVLVFAVRGGAVWARVGGTFALTAAVVFVLPGPPFFSHYTAPWAATATRGATQSLDQNGHYRTEFWRSAIQVFLHHPLVGSGYHALATASAFYTPSNWARSTLAHDGYLQALTDGGLLLAIPFLAAALIVLSWALRPLWAIVRRRPEASPDAVLLTCAIALLAGFAHSAVDFDWSHASVLVEAVLLAACVAPVAVFKTGRRTGVSRYVGYGALLALGGVLAVSIPALHEWQVNEPSTLHSNDTLLADGAGPFGNYRPADTVLYGYIYSQRPLTQAQASKALAQTASEAEVDLHLALLRDAVGAETGLIPDAVADARRELQTHVQGSTAPYAQDLVSVLFAAGQDQGAQDLLTSDIRAQVQQGSASPTLVTEIEIWAQRLGSGPAYACEYKAARPLLQALGQAGQPPKPTAACPASDQGAG